MKTYSCGFAFSRDDRVALIRKARPEWQAGKLNGIGGHIEAGESEVACMSREFHEETGVLIPQKRWDPYATILGADFSCAFFRAFDADLSELRTTTDEEVVVVHMASLMAYSVIPNLHWLIPLAWERNIEVVRIIERQKE